MSTELMTPPADRPLGRAWKALIPAAIYWIVLATFKNQELPYFYRFLLSMGLPLLFFIAFSVWWWRNRAMAKSERALLWFVILASPFAAWPFLDKSVGLFAALTRGLPGLMTLVTVWYVVSRPWGAGARRAGIAVALLIVFGGMSLVRTGGVDGDLRADIHWRWTPTPEERLLAERRATTNLTAAAVANPGDWTGFRGPNADGVVRGLRIATDWKANPPKQLWKIHVGPAWSSMAVVGDRLFTQEQRGEKEAVVCFDASTGKEVWVHEDEARFYDQVSGAGPRATPTFADGKLYTFGGAGLLNCLDALTGKSVWSHDLAHEFNAVVPMWGFATSPLVTKGLVIVHGGGKDQNNLIAFQAETGSLAWRAKAGEATYASPQAATIAGKEQVVILTDHGLTSVDPADGRPLWSYGTPRPGEPRNLQPHVLDGGRIFVGAPGAEQMLGACMIDVAPSGDGWKVDERWATSQIKPEFSEFLIRDGHAYGFDGAFFCCIDLTSGKRVWKGNRYGRGQALLLADQKLILVIGEYGDLMLVAATPDKASELARMHALDGKTWNHMAVVAGRLFLRNGEEMACFQLPQVK